jgi:hypothetical protein
MKRHLSFVAALGMCFFASLTAAYAQVRADRAQARTGPADIESMSPWAK